MGQNITTGPDKFRMVRGLLEGKALADFEASIITNAYTETGPNLKLALGDVAEPLFPLNAISKQRCAIHHHMIKPQRMPVTV